MSFLKKIKQKLRLALLRRRMKKVVRKRRVIGYNSAKSIAIMAHAGDAGHHAFLRKFKDELERDHKSTVVIVFHLPEKKNVSIEKHQDMHYCTKKDFTVLFKPSTDFLKKIVEKKFDVLVDLTPPQTHWMKFLAAESRACYKVGSHSADYQTIYDLLLQVEDGCKASELAKHAIHYLKIIKTPGKDD